MSGWCRSRLSVAPQPAHFSAGTDRCAAFLALFFFMAVSHPHARVQLSGQPISASTNRGFSTRPAVEVRAPSVDVVGRRRPRTAASVRVTPAVLVSVEA
jgi:hypothetical protein